MEYKVHLPKIVKVEWDRRKEKIYNINSGGGSMCVSTCDLDTDN